MDFNKLYNFLYPKGEYLFLERKKRLAENLLERKSFRESVIDVVDL